MKRFKFKRFIRALTIALISTASLYGLMGLTTVSASFFPQLIGHACLAQYSGTHLTCTANDIRVSEVTNVTNPDGSTPVECVLGQEFDFKADFTIETTATSRYGYGIWLPEGNWSAKDESTTNTCSVLTGRTDGPGIDLDGDACADISKKAGNDPVHVYVDETITMLCRDDDNSGKADFNYCASWNQQEYGLCSGDDPTPAGSPSKCRCDTFDIDVFIKPDPPTLIKSLESSNTHTEPGGTYTFEVNFTNPNDNTSIFLTALSDEVDTTADGTYEDSLNLWGSLDTPAGDGVYLTTTNCSQPANGGEIGPSGSYSCQFTVTIVDSDLPDDQSPELYDDVIRGIFKDKNGDFVTNGETCPADISGVDGQFCSNKLQVNVTNLPPDIRVEKTADKDTVLEPGEAVAFTITVYNDSATYDSPVIVTSLMDSIYGDLTALGDCGTIGSIAYGGSDSCTFTETVSGDQGESFTNTVTAIARDNEFDTDTASDSHTVLVLDVPSMIDLTKTANPTVVLETGDDLSIFRDVVFTFLFSVDAAGVDDVTFNALDDTVFGDILADCNVDMLDGNPITPVPLDGYTLSPGHNASCSITRGLQGDDDDTHLNVATIGGTDEDGAALTAMDDATVEFDPVAPASDMAFATSMLVVLEMHNAGIEDITLTSIMLKGTNVVDGAGNTEFTILNSVGGNYNNIPYPACNIGEVLGYNGSVTDTYSCAFTIELKPGLENATDIAFTAPIGNGVIVTFTDDDGEPSSNAVGIQVLTDEP